MDTDPDVDPPLIPILYHKISKERWLERKLPYETDGTDETDFCTADILEDMSLRVYQWLSTKDDLEVTIDYDSFQTDFINLLYDKYLK